MAGLEIIELIVTKEIKVKNHYIVDRSIERYNQHIEDMYDSETEYNEIEQSALNQRKDLHLKQLRKNKDER